MERVPAELTVLVMKQAHAKRLYSENAGQRHKIGRSISGVMALEHVSARVPPLPRRRCCPPLLPVKCNRALSLLRFHPAHLAWR